MGRTVLLDSVQPQANRMELALLDSLERGKIDLPLVVTNFRAPLLIPGWEIGCLDLLGSRRRSQVIAASIGKMGNAEHVNPGIQDLGWELIEVPFKAFDLDKPVRVTSLEWIWPGVKPESDHRG